MNIKTETMHNITGSVASELNNGRSSVRSVVIVALALWFGLVFFLASQGAFVTNPGSPPLPIFLGFAIPLSLFFAAYFGWTPFRDFILGADLRFVAAMQSWRWAGHFSSGSMPGVFCLDCLLSRLESETWRSGSRRHG